MTIYKYKIISLIFFSIVVGLVLANIVSVEMESKTDELWHVNVGKYYSSNWNFPPIGSDKTKDTYSPYGYSYIDSWDIVYYIAGRFYNLTNFLEKYYFINFRLFQLLLFLFLLFKVYKLKDNISIIMVLLITPQIWHLISYFNGDFFPLILSFLIVVQLIDRNSLINRYINSDSVKISFSANPFLFSIYLGLIFISKINYYVFILFLFLYLIWKWYNLEKEKFFAWKWFMVFLLAAGVALPRIIIDFKNNGIHKKEKIIAYAETMASPNFKPSVYGTHLSSPTISMKKRGVSITELFTIYKWHEKSLITLMAEFSYIKIIHFENYYSLMGFLLFLYLMFIIYVGFIKVDKNIRILFTIFIISFILMLSISIYHSWVNDFQPQSRYLFPMLAPLSLLLFHCRSNINKYFLYLSTMIAILGIYAYAFHANRYIPKIITSFGN